MRTLQLQLVIDRAAAVRAGHSQYGEITVDVDVAALTEAQREALLSLPTNGSIALGDQLGCYNSERQRRHEAALPVLPDASIESVRLLLDAAGPLLAAYRTERAAEAAEAVRIHEEHTAAAIATIQAAPVEDLVSDSPRRESYAAGDHRLGYTPVLVDWRRHVVTPADFVAIEKACAEKIAAAKAEAARLTAQRIDEAAARVDQLHAADVARAAARRQVIEQWVADRGDQSQRERLAEGLLPEKEILEAIEAQVLAPITAATYEGLAIADISHGDECYNDHDEDYLDCDVVEGAPIPAELWPSYRAIRAQAPQGATLTVRQHTCRCTACDATGTRYGVRVRVVVADGLVISREFRLVEQSAQYPERSE